MAVHVVGRAIGLTVVGLVEDRPDPFEERVVIVIIIFDIIDDQDVVYLFQYRAVDINDRVDPELVRKVMLM